MEKLRIQDLDDHFKDELALQPGCQHLRRCFSCGVCTATCPVAAITPEFSPSRILRQILYGLRQELLTSPALWHCLGCAQCSFQCPQDVRFLDIIQGLRTMAEQAGLVTPDLPRRCRQAEALLLEVRRRLLARVVAAPESQESLTGSLQAVVRELADKEEK